MKIAILYICTGRYSVFWEDFYLSCEKNFINEASKDYFLFTDDKDIEHQDTENVNFIYQEKLGWPYDTLDRFSVFSRVKERLKQYDYLFFFNANSLVVGKVDKSILDADYPLIGALQPVYYKSKNTDFPYERNPVSTAYMKEGEGKHYYMGSFNGGKSDEYLKMIEELIKRIEIDKSNNIIPVWHDESHLNRYYFENHNKVKVLSPSFAYPEEMKLPFEKINILRSKRKLGGHNYLRGISGKKRKTLMGIQLEKIYLSLVSKNKMK